MVKAPQYKRGGFGTEEFIFVASFVVVKCQSLKKGTLLQQLLISLTEHGSLCNPRTFIRAFCPGLSQRHLLVTRSITSNGAQCIYCVNPKIQRLTQQMAPKRDENTGNTFLSARAKEKILLNTSRTTKSLKKKNSSSPFIFKPQ